MGVEFSSPKEFRAVMDRIFTLMSEDPDMGPKLRDADVPQRFEFEDVDMVVNIRAAEEGEEGCLYWEWNDDVDWKPKVKMSMSSETANKYFQGKENVPIAIARRRIKTSGDVKAALALIPITKPVYAQYREVVEAEYPHLRCSEAAARRALSPVDSATREAYESVTRSKSGWLAIREAPPVRRRAPSTEAAGPIARRRRDHGPAVVLSAAVRSGVERVVDGLDVVAVGIEARTRRSSRGGTAAARRARRCRARPPRARPRGRRRPPHGRRRAARRGRRSARRIARARSPGTACPCRRRRPGTGSMITR